MRESSSARIPNFLVAGGPSDLRRLMLLNNIRLGQEVQYQNIQMNGGKWYAWYYEDASSLVADESVKKMRAK